MKTLLTALFLIGMALELSFAQAPFFQDKTITVVLGGPPAGSADLRTRAVINILRKHIPGNPTIVIQNMGGGGGRQAANHVYKVAKPDGLVVLGVRDDDRAPYSTRDGAEEAVGALTIPIVGERVVAECSLQKDESVDRRIRGVGRRGRRAGSK